MPINKHVFFHIFIFKTKFIKLLTSNFWFNLNRALNSFGIYIIPKILHKFVWSQSYMSEIIYLCIF